MTGFVLAGAAFAGLLLLVYAIYLAAPATLYRGIIVLLVRVGRLRPQSVDSGGIRWPYLEGGPDGGETVVLLHGFGSQKEHWALYARALTGRYHVIIPDLPGFGQNTNLPDIGFDIASQAVRLERFLDALDIGRCHLAGHSMGGYIASVFALGNQERLESIALIDSAGFSGSSASELDLAVVRGENLLAVQSPDDVDRLLTLNLYKPPKVPRGFKRVIYEQTAARQSFLDRTYQVLSREWHREPLNEAATQIGLPALVIWGRNDRLTDVSCADAIRASISGSRVVILENTGHTPILECPARTARHHVEFLAGLG